MEHWNIGTLELGTRNQELGTLIGLSERVRLRSLKHQNQLFHREILQFNEKSKTKVTETNYHHTDYVLHLFNQKSKTKVTETFVKLSVRSGRKFKQKSKTKVTGLACYGLRVTRIGNGKEKLEIGNSELWNTGTLKHWNPEH